MPLRKTFQFILVAPVLAVTACGLSNSGEPKTDFPKAAVTWKKASAAVCDQQKTVWQGRPVTVKSRYEVPNPVVELSPGDSWSFGDEGTAHLDGKQNKSYPINSHGVAVLGPDDIWAADISLSHWDGKRWTRVPDMPELFDVAATSTQNVWALGPKAVLRYNGTKWTNMTPNILGKLKLTTVITESADTAWAGTEDGQVLRYHKGAWHISRAPSSDDGFVERSEIADLILDNGRVKAIVSDISVSHAEVVGCRVFDLEP